MNITEYIELIKHYVEKNMFDIELKNGGTFTEPYINATWQLGADTFKITTPRGSVLTPENISLFDSQMVAEIGEMLKPMVNNPQIAVQRKSFQKELDDYIKSKELDDAETE